VLNEKLSTTSTAYLALLTQKGFSKSFKRDVRNALENRIQVDSRGAYAAPNPANTFPNYYGTPVKDTALLLKSLVADDNAHPLIANMIRWLVAARGRDGSWESTNNTVTVIDAFTDFLVWSGETKSKFDLKLSLNGADQAAFSFTKDTILETMETTIPVSGLKRGEMNTIAFDRVNEKNGKNYYFDMRLMYHLPIEQIRARDEGISVERQIRTFDGTKPVLSAKVGDVLKGTVRITTVKPRVLFGFEDMIPAGTELINFNLATSDQTLLPEENESTYNNRELIPDFTELHRDRVFLFREYLPAGTYEYTYYLRASVPGVFVHLPATASELYFPENFGRTAGGIFTVRQ